MNNFFSLLRPHFLRGPRGTAAAAVPPGATILRRRPRRAARLSTTGAIIMHPPLATTGNSSKGRKLLSSTLQPQRSAAAPQDWLRRRPRTSAPPPPPSVLSSLSAAAHRRAMSTTATAPAEVGAAADPIGAPPPTPPPPIVWTTHKLTSEQIHKVDTLFHKILWLDMIETAILVDVMNARLGRVTMTSKQKSLLERHMNAFGIDGGSGGDSAAAAADGSTGEAPKEETIKLVDLKLVGFDDKQKIKVIKEVRSMLGLGLKEAKELVESAPKVISKQLKPEQAKELMDKLVAAGAQVEVS